MSHICARIKKLKFTRKSLIFHGDIFQNFHPFPSEFREWLKALFSHSKFLVIKNFGAFLSLLCFFVFQTFELQFQGTVFFYPDLDSIFLAQQNMLKAKSGRDNTVLNGARWRSFSPPASATLAHLRNPIFTRAWQTFFKVEETKHHQLYKTEGGLQILPNLKRKT